MQPTLADSICDIRTRKIKRTFFTQINTLLDWNPIVKVLKVHYTKGKSATGKPSYSGLLLFKMSLLQTWYGLSDYEVEDRVNDSISFSYFCGLHIDQVAPDHSTLSRFRTMMTKAKAYEPLFKEINRQLEAHKIIVKTGAIIDASVIDTPLRPKGKTNHKVTEDRKDEQEVAVTKDYADSVDKDAAWLKKGGKYRFGYKKHHVTDNEGLVLGVLTTKASTNEIANLEEVATEFDIQGLEIDWACVAWGGNFHMDGNDWKYQNFKGAKWQNINKEIDKEYLKNTYRVILTRARQGMVIFIPESSDIDHTRPKEFYDNTFEYLKTIGIQVL